MSRLSKKSWSNVLNEFAKSRNLERRGLRHIHDERSHDELAMTLVEHLELMGIRAAVRVGSVWIDGTPQAIAHTHRPKSVVQCELADLLIILDARNNGRRIRESALLIQGKVGCSPLEIPSGSSTNKERALLERFNDQQPLKIYKNTQATSLIGEFNIKTGSLGFKKYARFLVMPLDITTPIVRGYGPFITGWPKQDKSHQLTYINMLADAPVLLWNHSIGMPLTDPSRDEWTRLVKKLAGHYSNSWMKRFNGFRRIIRSPFHMSYMSLNYSETYMTKGYFLNDTLPPNSLNLKFEDEIEPPLISLLKIDVDVQGEWEEISYTFRE